jgi:Helix-hairpin-helix motif
MVSKTFIFVLCCSVGVALPFAVSAQLTKPQAPGSVAPSVPGGMPSTPGGVPATNAQDLTMPGTGGGSTPASTDMPAPVVTPSPSPSLKPVPSSTTPKKPGKSTTVTVNVNSSTLSELTKVKGIGVPTAKKIILYRPYSSMEQLVTKKALTPKQLTELKSQLSL